MRGSEFLDKLEWIDPALIQAAEEPPPRRRAVWLGWGGLAACLCVAAAAVLALGRGHLPLPGSDGAVPGPVPTQAAAPTATVPASAAPEGVWVDMDKVFVNELDGPMLDACRIPYDPEKYDEDVRWDAAAVMEYYGRPLTPSYLPEGLTPTNPDGSARVVICREDGSVAEDTVYFGYYRQFGVWDDGTPRFIDQRNVGHGFDITASRLGRLGCCLYRYDEVKQSDITGTPVTIGYCSVGHGPHDPETHAPAGYYDLYVAEFTLDGIEFQVTAEEMELDEVVKVVASIICPDGEIVLKQAEP